METVLRKVNTRDRLPIKKDYYFTLLFTNTDWKDRAVREYSPSYDNWWKENVEYWYEEVSLEDLAKERYEKALAFINENTWYDGDPFDKSSPSLDKDDVIKALKIATGLEE